MLGWILYLISVLSVFNTLVTVVMVISGGIVATTFLCRIWDINDTEAEKLWEKVKKTFGVILCITIPLNIFIPTKETCYQIFAITAATEVVKKSEALQQFPEKSFETLNRFLDSIAKEENEEKESHKD